MNKVETQKKKDSRHPFPLFIKIKELGFLNWSARVLEDEETASSNEER